MAKDEVLLEIVAIELYSRISKDGRESTHCSGGLVETDDGIFHLDLTADEMDADTVFIDIRRKYVALKEIVGDGVR